MESLARFLRERADGHVIDRADSAAISVLKTYRPDLTALHGRVIRTPSGTANSWTWWRRLPPARTAASPATGPCTS